MKQLFTLLFAFVAITTLMAQSANTVSNKLEQHHAIINGILRNQTAPEMKSTTSLHIEVLKAQSTRDNTKDSLNDSVRIMYGGIDTSIYDYNMMLYPYNYPYSTSPMFNNNRGVFTTAKVWYSSYYHWAVDPNTLEYGFYEKDGRGYDYIKNLTRDTAQYADSSFIPNMNYLNTFAGNSILASYAFTYAAGKSDSAYRQYFAYTAGNLTKDSTYEYVLGGWHLISRTLYTYDISNNLIQIDNYANTMDTTYTKPLPEQFQYINTYDGSHRMLTVNAKQNDGLNLKPYVADTFAYTAAHNYHSSWKEYQYDVINLYWAPISYMTKHINVAGVPDTVNIDSYDSLSKKWVPYTKDVIEYDSLNNPDTLFDYEYNYTKFPPKPNFTTVYYYNYVLDPNAVNNITVLNDKIKVYPDPAHESVTVSGIDGKNTLVWISLYDMQGRLCSKQETSVKNGNIQLPVTYLSTGTYMITLQDTAGTILHKQLLVKE